MFTVYVRHYLTAEGIQLVCNHWYQQVLAIMSQQQGYIRFIHDLEKDYEDCVNLIVTFESKKKLEQWVRHPEHDNLIAQLDSFRSRSYWEFAICEKFTEEPSNLSWEKVN